MFSVCATCFGHCVFTILASGVQMDICEGGHNYLKLVPKKEKNIVVYKLLKFIVWVVS